MSYIFISYSHKDSGYAHKLAESLKERDFEVWIDDRIDYGTQWPHVIQENLDGCSAFIIIMTPRSYQSEWVQNELSRAKRKRKPVFPLLLEGSEPWLSVEATQYCDVRGGKLPPAHFYSRLASVVPVGARVSEAADVVQTDAALAKAIVAALKGLTKPEDVIGVMDFVTLPHLDMSISKEQNYIEVSMLIFTDFDDGLGVLAVNQALASQAFIEGLGWDIEEYPPHLGGYVKLGFQGTLRNNRERRALANDIIAIFTRVFERSVGDLEIVA